MKSAPTLYLAHCFSNHAEGWSPPSALNTHHLDKIFAPPDNITLTVMRGLEHMRCSCLKGGGRWSYSQVSLVIYETDFRQSGLPLDCLVTGSRYVLL